MKVMESMENETGLKTCSSVGWQDGQSLISDHRERSIEAIYVKKVKKKCQENISHDQTLLKDFLPLPKSIQPTVFKIKDLNPLASIPTFGASVLHHLLLNLILRYFEEELGNFCVTGTLTLEFERAKTKLSAAFIWTGIKRVQMTEEENVSLLYSLNDLSSVVLNVAIKLQFFFSVRLIGNSWNSERPAALNVFWHRRISSDTSFLWPDSSELKNESLNFTSLRSESFWSSLRHNEVALQFSQKQCLHPNTNTDAWHIVALSNCFGLSQELTARRWKPFFWCTTIKDVRMLTEPNTDIHSGRDPLLPPATASIKETITVQLDHYSCTTPGSVTYVSEFRVT